LARLLHLWHLAERMRIARWFIAIVGGVLVTLWIVALAGSRTSVLRDALVKTLNDKLDATVELDTFRVHTFPTLRISGDNLRVRLRGRRSLPSSTSRWPAV
jgi:hypothetical protein